MKTYLCVYFGSLFMALVTTPVVIWLARRTGAVDRPGVRTVHERPTPRIGGVAIFISAMALILAVLFLDNKIGESFREVRAELTTLLCAASLVFLMGLVDDLRGLPARFKFITELIAAAGLCAAGVRISDIGLTDGFVLALGLWGCPLTLLWVVGITNAVNLSDGLDGLAAGISAITCGVIAVISVYGGDPIMAVFMLALLGSLSGFLYFNFNPARIFMGDCGSLFLGFTIAASSVMCVCKSAAFVGLALPALALGVPIFDTLFAMLRRFLERRSLFAPDRGHFHHRLLDMGLRQRHVVIAIYLATLLFTGLGLFMMTGNNIHSLVVFGCVLVLILVLFRVVGIVRLRETIARLREKHSITCRERQEQKTFEDLQLRFRRARDREPWWQDVCDAAKRMDFAWISLKTIHADGKVETEVWRGPKVAVDTSGIMTMRMPLHIYGEPRVSREIEFAIWTNGHVESAGHRAALFSRLMDEGAAIMRTDSARLASHS